MTKEEYRKLLESDYWKGFSYSIIKERNFTCEDCGARYPGERNMLQVHHLVYRDIKPWAYQPQEMVVLCRNCHAKRHGKYTSTSQPKADALDKEVVKPAPEFIPSKDYVFGFASGSDDHKPNKSDHELSGCSILILLVLAVITFLVVVTVIFGTY